MRILLGADLVVRIGEMRMLLFRGSLSLNWDNGCLTGTTGVSPVDILNGQDARSPSEPVPAVMPGLPLCWFCKCLGLN